MYLKFLFSELQKIIAQNRTLALLRPSSTATKEREAAEKARREAEERAAGIEPKIEESRDDKKDEKNERPKIVWFKPVCFEELVLEIRV